MLSKQDCAYHWAFMVAAVHFVTSNVLCDEACTVFKPFREMIINNDCLKRLTNRLDKHPLL